MKSTKNYGLSFDFLLIMPNSCKATLKLTINKIWTRINLQLNMCLNFLINALVGNLPCRSAYISPQWKLSM